MNCNRFSVHGSVFCIIIAQRGAHQWCGIACSSVKISHLWFVYSSVIKCGLIYVLILRTDHWLSLLPTLFNDWDFPMPMGDQHNPIMSDDHRQLSSLFCILPDTDHTPETNIIQSCRMITGNDLLCSVPCLTQTQQSYATVIFTDTKTLPQLYHQRTTPQLQWDNQNRL